MSVAADLPQLEVPARIAWGTADPFQKLQYGERFAMDLNASMRRITGGRHFTPEDHPDVIADEIQALLGPDRARCVVVHRRPACNRTPAAVE